MFWKKLTLYTGYFMIFLLGIGLGNVAVRGDILGAGAIVFVLYILMRLVEDWKQTLAREERLAKFKVPEDQEVNQ
jgi:hypothetical protein